MMERLHSGSILILILLLSAVPSFHAQVRKPRQALRDLEKRQESLFKDFERDVSDGKVQAWEWDERSSVIRRSAGEAAASYRPADWEGEELLALAELWLVAEDYARAAVVYRAAINSDSRRKEVDGLDIRTRLAEVLIRSDQLDSAGAVMQQLKKEKSDDRVVMFALVGLYRELALALRDSGYQLRAADAAYDGYQLADVNKLIRIGSPQLIERLLRDQLSMAALYVALNEQMSRTKSAVDFDKTVRKFDFRQQTYLLDHYEKELATARMIGTPAPVLKHGVAGDSIDPAKMRGRIVLLDFTATWCTPCAAAFPHWREFQSRFADRGFEIVGVTRLYGRTDKGIAESADDELKALREYRKANNLTYPYLVAALDDVTNEERFGVDSIPTVVILDREGIIRHIKRGIGDYRRLGRFIERLVK